MGVRQERGAKSEKGEWGGGEWIDECPMYRLCGVATEHHDTGPESATLREPEQVFSVILVSEKEELPLVGG